MTQNLSTAQAALSAKVEKLHALFEQHAPLVIAYSGGVDSAYLLAAARAALGSRMLGVVADSASLPRQALADALALATQIGAPVEVIATEELQDERYTSNPLNRCYYCKAELFTKLDELARARGYTAIAYGENADDMRQVRPGRQAATEFSVIAPLRDAGLTKEEIRELSRELGLPTADAPAQPCLSSRIPHGSPVTIDALGMIERGEALVRSLGFKIFRVRHVTSPGETRARVMIAPEELARVAPLAETLTTGLRAIGYDAVEIDPEGYRPPGG